MQLTSDGALNMHEERFTIATCFEKIGFDYLAKMVTDPHTKQQDIPVYLNIVEKISRDKKRQDVLEILEFAGLIYGLGRTL